MHLTSIGPDAIGLTSPCAHATYHVTSLHVSTSLPTLLPISLSLSLHLPPPPLSLHPSLSPPLSLSLSLSTPLPPVTVPGQMNCLRSETPHRHERALSLSTSMQGWAKTGAHKVGFLQCYFCYSHDVPIRKEYDCAGVGEIPSS